MRTFNILVSKYFKEKVKLSEVLLKATSLGHEVLADAAAKGAVWHQKNGKGKILKIRTTSIIVAPEDKINFYYDPRILTLPMLVSVECLYEAAQYGIWLKPAGVLPQGTQSSDHTSLLRYVEKQKKKDVFLIHRLDRETEGLMIIGYTSEAAAKLGNLFLHNKIKKTYQAVVKGELETGYKSTINDSLDGKDAITHFEVLGNQNGKSLLSINIDTGRLHQIRRHLEIIGYPVMGDPKYGKGNKNREGLKLLAKALNFIDPWTLKAVSVSLGHDLTY
jgi:tRNA pseudouridine32 synthase / 23S rRNA pseudouridine746 synthase